MQIDKRQIELSLAERAMTIKTLAAACGCSRQHISVILARGTCAPITAGKIAKALGVSTTHILKGEE